MKSIISEGKTSNEAIEKGLKELGCNRNDVTIKVIESEEKRSFYSILDPRTVKVELTIKENEHTHEKHINTEERILSDEDFNNAKQDLEIFFNDFITKFDELTYSIDKKDNMIEIKLDGASSSKLIGYRGDIINSLQVILSAIGNKHTKERAKVTLDICNYKEKREATLKELAKKLERTVCKTGKKIVLEPMSAYERKILHTELQNSKSVTTYSIGEEPHRKLVVDKK